MSNSSQVHVMTPAMPPVPPVLPLIVPPSGLIGQSCNGITWGTWGTVDSTARRRHSDSIACGTVGAQHNIACGRHTWGTAQHSGGTAKAQYVAQSGESMAQL